MYKWYLHIFKQVIKLRILLILLFNLQPNVYNDSPPPDDLCLSVYNGLLLLRHERMLNVEISRTLFCDRPGPSIEWPVATDWGLAPAGQGPSGAQPQNGGCRAAISKQPKQ